MLAKTYRLKKRKDFESVFKKGERFKEDFLILIKSKNNLNHSRFGFIVGSKVSKRAIVRNKIKRRLRKLVQVRILKIKTGIDVVLIAQPGLENEDFRKIETIIDKIFKKAKII